MARVSNLGAYLHPPKSVGGMSPMSKPAMGAAGAPPPMMKPMAKPPMAPKSPPLRPAPPQIAPSGGITALLGLSPGAVPPGAPTMRRKPMRKAPMGKSKMPAMKPPMGGGMY